MQVMIFQNQLTIIIMMLKKKQLKDVSLKENFTINIEKTILSSQRNYKEICESIEYNLKDDSIYKTI